MTKEQRKLLKEVFQLTDKSYDTDRYADGLYWRVKTLLREFGVALPEDWRDSSFAD